MLSQLAKLLISSVLIFIVVLAPAEPQRRAKERQPMLETVELFRYSLLTRYPQPKLFLQALERDGTWYMQASSMGIASVIVYAHRARHARRLLKKLPYNSNVRFVE
jgi:hypothetical protein